MFNRRIYLTVLCAVWLVSTGNTQEQPASTVIPLNNLDAFVNPGANWSVAGDATADLKMEGMMKPVPGVGTIVNIVSKENRSHLMTKQEFGDVELEMDFMMAKGSNSGIYLQGRYEVQLLDSWGKLNPAYGDCGGIYQRWDNHRPEGSQGYEGIPPLMNTSRAPGLWQHIRIKFRAPRFDGSGKKIENARFEEVFLNGVLVQQQAEVTGPTRSPAFDGEKPEGPVMFQGDHGNVAFRNISYRKLSDANTTPTDTRLVDPILLKVEGKPYLLRSFIIYKDKLLTHGISVGDSREINYSYDMKRGALFQVWRGQFADATDLWYSRGEPYQRIVPLGSVIVLSDAPALAVLSDVNMTRWPDSLSFDDLMNKGYTLDAERSPTFNYQMQGMDIADKIVVSGHSGITRTVTVKNAPANLYFRIAAGSKIEIPDKELYAVNGKQFYVSVSGQLKPVVRKVNGMEELLVPVKSDAPVSYSLIW